VSERLSSGIQKLKDKLMGRGGKTAGGEGEGAATVTPPSLPSVLCLGIGHGVHRGLLDGCAARTGGVAQFVVEGESIARKVGLLKKAALAGQDAVSGLRLSASGGVLLRTAPHALPPRLFPGEPFHVLAHLPKLECKLEEVVITLHGKRGDGRAVEMQLPLRGVQPVQVRGV
jgi:hypothetical protein